MNKIESKVQSLLALHQERLDEIKELYERNDAIIRKVLALQPKLAGTKFFANGVQYEMIDNFDTDELAAYRAARVSRWTAKEIKPKKAKETK